MPEPVEPQDSSVDQSQSLTCTLYVECSRILNNMDSLTKGKESLAASDGIIYGPATTAAVILVPALGALVGFVSNFFFGQGSWTSWQMFAYGIWDS